MPLECASQTRHSGSKASSSSLQLVAMVLVVVMMVRAEVVVGVVVDVGWTIAASMVGRVSGAAVVIAAADAVSCTGAL